ncbi:MAG: WbuC family cupin fold metalloprotein [Rhodospirillales bacterium]|nr:WbuC family cupin fold metalloprotein [Rhodospirillales bacterium]
MSGDVFHCEFDVCTVGGEWLDRLRVAACSSPRRRARLCLHRGPSDPVQEMIIVLCRDVLFRPHRHRSKSESLHIIDGDILVVLFDEHGRVTSRIALAAPGDGRPFAYRLAADIWHTVIPATEFVALHESVAGPYVPEDTEFAPWAPNVEGPELAAYLRRLEAAC